MKAITMIILGLYFFEFSNQTVMPYRPPNRIYFEQNEIELTDNSLLRLSNWLSYIKTPGLIDTSLIIITPNIFACDSFSKQTESLWNYKRAIEIKNYLEDGIRNPDANILIDPMALVKEDRNCFHDSAFISITISNCFKDSTDVKYIHLKLRK